MDDSRREQIENLSRHARSLDQDQQTRFLVEACTGDAALYADVIKHLGQRASPLAATVAGEVDDSSPELTAAHSDFTNPDFALAAEHVETLALDAVEAGLAAENIHCADDRRPSTSRDQGETSTDESSHRIPAPDNGFRPQDSDPMVGSLIGPYQVTAKIGSGGMGNVFCATRVEEFAQQVAIKLIKRGMDSDMIVRRFRTEIRVQGAPRQAPEHHGTARCRNDRRRPSLLCDGVHQRTADR